MEQRLEISFQSGSGCIPEGLEELRDAGPVFGLDISLCRRGVKGSADLWIPAALILYIPIKILGRVLKRFVEDAGDTVYERMKAYVSDFFKANNDTCQFGIEARDEDGVQIKIFSKNLTHSTVDSFFEAGQLFEQYLSRAEYPTKNVAMIYLDYDCVNRQIKEVICIDRNIVDQYTYDPNTKLWGKL